MVVFLEGVKRRTQEYVSITSTAFYTGSVPRLSEEWGTPEHATQARSAREECWEGKEEREAFSPLPISPFVATSLDD